ncbi:MAG: hypothetical protein AB7S38_11235 [Vulcanimicrobiota bacterium]
MDEVSKILITAIVTAIFSGLSAGIMVPLLSGWFNKTFDFFGYRQQQLWDARQKLYAEIVGSFTKARQNLDVFEASQTGTEQRNKAVRHFRRAVESMRTERDSLALLAPSSVRDAFAELRRTAELIYGGLKEVPDGFELDELTRSFSEAYDPLLRAMRVDLGFGE